MTDHSDSSPSPITYRAIRPGDDAAVRDLYELVQLSHAMESGDNAVVEFVRSHVDEVFDEDLAEPYLYFTLPGQGCWVAEVGSRLVGMACIERWPGEDRVGRLRHVMVDPAWRRNAIASTTLNLAERWAGDNGYSAVRLTTTELNATAVEMYRRRGYMELERRPGRVTTAITMEKDVTLRSP